MNVGEKTGDYNFPAAVLDCISLVLNVCEKVHRYNVHKYGIFIYKLYNLPTCDVQCVGYTTYYSFG